MQVILDCEQSGITHARRAERDVLVKCEKPFSELKHALAASTLPVGLAGVSRMCFARRDTNLNVLWQQATGALTVRLYKLAKVILLNEIKSRPSSENVGVRNCHNTIYNT